MPRQRCVAKRERKVDILIFYKMRDDYFVRVQSSLSSERVKNSPEFKNTMTHAHRLGIASRLASIIYRQLPPAWKLHDLYRKLTGHAITLLKAGMDPNVIIDQLKALLYESGYRQNIEYQTIHASTAKAINFKGTRKAASCKQRHRRRPEKRQQLLPGHSLLVQLQRDSGVHRDKMELPFCNMLRCHHSWIHALRAPPGK